METFTYVAILAINSGTPDAQVYAWGMRTLESCERWQTLFTLAQPKEPQDFRLTLCMPWAEFRRLHPVLPLQDS